MSAADEPEFCRMIDARAVDGRMLTLAANAAECRMLAQRFGLVAVSQVKAELLLTRDGEVIHAKGRLKAAIIQSCAVSGEDLPVAIDEPVRFRFVPKAQSKPPSDAEIELDLDELDEIAFADTHFDLGEAVAQSLALAIDPYAIGPDAEVARTKAGIISEGANGPFAALGQMVKK